MKILDTIVKYWVILAAAGVLFGAIGTAVHTHASEGYYKQQDYNLKADKERDLLRMEYEIERLRREAEKAPLAQDRKDDLVYYVGEKAYIQRQLREMKK